MAPSMAKAIMCAMARSRPVHAARQSCGAWLSGLPVPSLIAINRKEYPCDEANIELEFDQPGKYRIVVRAWPYLDMEFDLENPPL